jgi:integration host factor subunit beta
MTKSELIRCISVRFPALTVADTEAAVDLILNKMTQTLASGNRIEIRGFGSFALNYRPPRAGRNPKTGQRVDISAKYVPHFKAGKELRNRVDVAAVPIANQ